MTLPIGWASAPLGHICELLNGRAYKQQELLSDGKYPVLRVGNFFSNRGWYYSDLELDADKYCHNGDLLYAWSASFGPKIWDGGTAIFHYHIWRTRLQEAALDKRFLYYWFVWDKDNLTSDHGTGSTMIHVTKHDMEARRIKLPPLAEQRRIVKKLDALTARITRARAELDRLPQLSEKLRKSSVERVFSSPGLTGHTLGSLVFEGPANGWSPQSGADARGALTLKLTATTSTKLRLDSAAIKRIYELPPPDSKFWLEPGDLLVQRANSIEYVGAAAIFDGPQQTYIYPDLMMRLRFRNPLLTRLVWYFLNSPTVRQALRDQATGTAGNMPKISGKILRELNVPLPPERCWEMVLSQLDAAFARADRLEAEAAQAKTLLDRLESAILAKAFKGELVPQDPTDEPAETLLARIRAQRTTAPAKRGRRVKELA